MNLLYIYILFYVVFILFTRQKSKKVVFVSILTMYLCSSIAALYIYGIMYQGAPIVLSAIAFHIAMLFLLLYPLQKFDKIRFVDIPKEKMKEIDMFSIIIIVLCLIKIFYDIQNIDIGILLSDVQSLRNSLIEGQYRSSNVILRYLCFFAGQYWSIALVLAFYYMRHYPHKSLLIALLFISSLGVIVSGLTVAAREYLIKYVFLFLVLTYWFLPTIMSRWRRTIRTLLFVFGGFFVSFFLLITFLRFGDNSHYAYTPLESLLSYLGQGYIYFSSYFLEFPEGATGGAVKFPFFVGRSISAFNLEDVVYSNVTLNTFSTTIGSWVLDVGIYWTVIITLIHFFIFKRVGNKRVTVFTLIYIIWIYDFIFSAMFFYNETLNGSRIMSILFVVIFEKLCIHKSSRIAKVNI